MGDGHVSGSAKERAMRATWRCIKRVSRPRHTKSMKSVCYSHSNPRRSCRKISLPYGNDMWDRLKNKDDWWLACLLVSTVIHRCSHSKSFFRLCIESHRKKARALRARAFSPPPTASRRPVSPAGAVLLPMVLSVSSLFLLSP